MRRLAAIGAGVAAGLTLGGCGVLSGGVYDTPLPGGADVGSNPLHVTADFEDVLDLVPQSSVKVDNVAVGRVQRITLNPDGRSARVELVVNRDAELPAGTTARLQQTSLLGEKYVGLVRPDTAAAGPAIASGDRLGLADTSQAAQVEQVLGSLSMVLNGGGIGQFQEISRELQKVSAGRTDDVKKSLRQIEAFVSSLDDRKESITSALDGLAALSTTLDSDKAKIASALEGLSPGMKVLVDQREQLVSMLRSLDRLSSVTVDTLDTAQDDIVADLQALEPILQQLAKSGQDLPESLQILLTYPFPDSVLGAIKGDYLNVFLETNFRTLPTGCDAIGCSWPQVEDPNASAPATSADRRRLPQKAPSPSLLPPTDSAVPGMPRPTVSVPSSPAPTSPSPTTPEPSKPSPSQPTAAPSASPTPTRDEPTATPTPTPTPKDGGE
ncbi:MCE family protein [Aeromicrobium fastidiosum]|uniref:MCE family protein n=1 Tax=Aeromicrobium fastidiosum TaxID=52699 RepID=UPI002023867B|nr:MCE family protein [Aeromicrobium fastidiosum]MCL8250079.1 MCE family protein [Aeromicrobium fastidiosum]